jgi:hypothetical protein
MDDFVTDYENKDNLIKNAVPAGFDKKFTEVPNVNEKGRSVRSPNFINVDSALKGFAASFARRRKIFLNDVKTFGYPASSKDELVYWTYLYYNPGEFAGRGQLKKFKGKRTFSDWIKKGEYPKSLVALTNFKTLEDLKLF